MKKYDITYSLSISRLSGKTVETKTETIKDVDIRKLKEFVVEYVIDFNVNSKIRSIDIDKLLDYGCESMYKVDMVDTLDSLMEKLETEKAKIEWINRLTADILSQQQDLFDGGTMKFYIPGKFSKAFPSDLNGVEIDECFEVKISN